MRNSISRMMPNKRDVIKVRNEYVPKRHLLFTKRQTYEKFKTEFASYPFKFTTFRKALPRQIKVMKLQHRRVCICVKDYNVDQKVIAMNQICAQLSPDLMTTVDELSGMTLCKTSSWLKDTACLERGCLECSVAEVEKYYAPILDVAKNQTTKWLEWEHVDAVYTNTKGDRINTKAWEQVQKSDTVTDLVKKISTNMETHTYPIYRARFQHNQEQILQQNLPLNHAIIHVDFSQNLALVAQDECESAHFAQKQITIHPVYLIRHGVGSTQDSPVLWKQSIVQISNNQKHDSDAVLHFTMQIIRFIMNNPGAVDKPTVLHRFTDNCATQYKSKHAFQHMKLYKDVFDIDVRYHYCEAGHGKGECDGIGATIKHGLTMMVLRDQIVLNSAYTAYLAAKSHYSTFYEDGVERRVILYLPLSSMKAVPKRDSPKSIPGTRSLHEIHLQSDDVFCYSDLSCVCSVCLGEVHGPCYYGQSLHKPRFFKQIIDTQTEAVEEVCFSTLD